MPLDEVAPIETWVASRARCGFTRFAKPDDLVATGAESSPLRAVGGRLLMVGAATGVPDAAGNRFPSIPMPLLRAGKSVSNFVEEHLLKVTVVRGGGEVFGDGNAFGSVVTLAKASGGSIPIKPPVGCQTVGVQ